MSSLLWLLVPIAVILIVGLFLRASGHARRPRQSAGPGNPANITPGMAAWRKRRAAAGKGDNWLTRPLFRIDTTRKKPVEFLPHDDEPGR